MKMIPDCVREKDRIQAELRKEYSGLSLKEQKKRMEKEILANPTLSGLYSEALLEADIGKVAEESPEYKTR